MTRRTLIEEPAGGWPPIPVGEANEDAKALAKIVAWLSSLRTNPTQSILPDPADLLRNAATFLLNGLRAPPTHLADERARYRKVKKHFAIGLAELRRVELPGLLMKHAGALRNSASPGDIAGTPSNFIIAYEILKTVRELEIARRTNAMPANPLDMVLAIVEMAERDLNKMGGRPGDDLKNHGRGDVRARHARWCHSILFQYCGPSAATSRNVIDLMCMVW